MIVEGLVWTRQHHSAAEQGKMLTIEFHWLSWGSVNALAAVDLNGTTRRPSQERADNPQAYDYLRSKVKARTNTQKAKYLYFFAKRRGAMRSAC